MLCQKCGNEIPQDSLFCPECGAKQEAAAEPGTAGAGGAGPVIYCKNCRCQMPAGSLFCPECGAGQQSSPKNNKRGLIIGISAGAAVLLCAVIAVLALCIKPTINLNKYLTVSSDGYDTVGKATVTFDEEKFVNDCDKKLKARSELFLFSCVGGALDKDRDLSNGDVVTFTWSCDDEYALEEFGCKLKYEDITYTVSDLKEAETFDPFQGMDVVFTGISPNGMANVEGEPVEAAREFIFELDRTYGLSNGDTVTVTANMYYDDPAAYCIEHYGKIPSPLTKTYTVEGLDRYVRSVSDISGEALESMQSQAEDVYNAYIAQSWGEGEKLKSFNCIGSYLLTNKNTDAYIGSDNLFLLVYRARINNKYSYGGEKYNKTNDVYWFICYYDLQVTPEGNTIVDVTGYNTTSDRVTVDSGISDGWWGTRTWSYYGYQTLDELYQAAVIANAEAYNHEDNIDESAADSGEDEQEEEEAEDGFIFPDSSERLLDEEEIEALSDEELRYAINELYARHGYIFKDEGIRSYYQEFDWYEQTVEPDDFSIDLFNDVEKTNTEALQRERDSRR